MLMLNCFRLNPKQNVYLNLFEVVHLPAMGNSDSIEMDGGGTVDYNNAKMGKCWLGQMKIPLYSLLFNSKIEGICVIKSNRQSIDTFFQIVKVCSPFAALIICRLTKVSSLI